MLAKLSAVGLVLHGSSQCPCRTSLQQPDRGLLRPPLPLSVVSYRLRDRLMLDTCEMMHPARPVYGSIDDYGRTGGVG